MDAWIFLFGAVGLMLGLLLPLTETKKENTTTKKTFSFKLCLMTGLFLAVCWACAYAFFSLGVVEKILWCLLIATLVQMSISDAKSGELSYFAVIFTVILGVAEFFVSPNGLWEKLLPLFIFGGGLLVVYLVGLLLRRSQAMGIADVLIFATITVFCGMGKTVCIFLFTILFCVIYGVFKALRKEKGDIPLLPSLTIATLLVQFGYDPILNVIQKEVFSFLL